jgi:hypothetical protein
MILIFTYKNHYDSSSESAALYLALSLSQSPEQSLSFGAYVLAGKRREESERKSKLHECWPGRVEKKGKGLEWARGKVQKKSLMGRPTNLVIGQSFY